jgi:hypothetical protein
MTDEDKITLTMLALSLKGKIRTDCPYGSLTHSPESYQHDELSGVAFQTCTDGEEYLYFTPCKRHLGRYTANKWKEVKI